MRAPPWIAVCPNQRLTEKPSCEAEYMTAPERFADSQIPLAPRAPSIHDPSKLCPLYPPMATEESTFRVGSFGPNSEVAG